MTRRHSIVVEGPDGAGKSTLCGTLSEKLGLPIVQTNGAIETPQEFEAKLRETLSHPRPAVFDRFQLFSEHVYSECLRGSVMRTDESILWSAWAFIQPAIVIYCRPSNEALEQGLLYQMTKAHKPEYFIAQVKERHPRIVSAYDKLMAKMAATWRARILWYNYSSGLDPILHAIEALDRQVPEPAQTEVV